MASVLRFSSATTTMSLKVTVVLLAFVATVNAEAPPGWHKAGSQREAYDIGIDAVGAHSGKGSGYIRSVAKVKFGKFGTAMQNIKADEYRGQTVRLSAFMKTSGAEKGAWVWLRIDDTESGWLDNMNDRLVKGTTAGSAMSSYFRFQNPRRASPLK